MKIAVTADYTDRVLKREVKKGETLEVTEDRACVLIGAKVAERKKGKEEKSEESKD